MEQTDGQTDRQTERRIPRNVPTVRHKNTVEYGEDEVQYDAARRRWRVVDGVVAISQSYIHRVLETALIALEVSQGHVPTYSTDEDVQTAFILNWFF